ncbi:MAG: hypothetical protein WBQ25_14380 [Nitrososphaeraceae archaeon]
MMIFSLDTEIEEYVEKEGLNKIKDKILQEYWRRKTNDRKIIDERLNDLNKDLYEGFKDSGLGNGNLLLEYIQPITDPLIRELTRLVMISSNVRIRRFEELEDANLEDSIMPNEWIYHKDMNSTEASNYVLAYYDNLRQDDDLDDPFEQSEV